MGYVRAEDILPKELISAIQQYADGVHLYIPRKCGERTRWGERNQTRQMLSARNMLILEEYCRGVSVEALAGRHYLSEKSMQRILREMKK